MRLKYLNLWEMLFPHQVRAGLWNVSRSTAGFALLACGIYLGAALLSWSAYDPSLSHATAAETGNWLGATGAVISDLMMQFFGIAAGVFVLTIAGWGWLLAAGHVISRPVGRVLAMVVAMALVGAFLSILPTPDNWPLVTAMGGVLGDATLAALASPMEAIAGPLGPAGESVLAALIAPAGVAVLAYASGFSISRALAGGSGAKKGKRGRSVPAAITLWVATALFAVLKWILVTLFSALRAIWRQISGAPPADPQERLRIAMARADDDDVAWTRTNRADDDEDEAYDEAEQRGGSFARALIARGGALLRGLLDTDDEPAVARRSERAEPRFDAPEPMMDDDVVGLAPAPAPAAAAPTPAPARKSAKARRQAMPEFDFDDQSGYQLPPQTLLNDAPPARPEDTVTVELLEENARLLEGVLDDFGVRGQIIDVRPGPVVTLYELEPAPGLKSSRVIGLADDIARSMSAISARVAVIPGRNVIGIELPNEHRQTVFLREVVASKAFASGKHALALTLGKTIGGEPVIADLARMPHLLIAGTTGSGKSVGINAMILSILFRMTPQECKLIMIDPKMLELSVYDGIPHLLSPVVTDPKKAVVALKWTVREMEARYKNMSKVGVRNIDGFNKRVSEAAAKGEVLSRTVQTGFDRSTGEAVYETEEMALEPMPYIVVVVDEMADLMMVAGKDIEGAIQRLAQMARAAGIHIIMATQRPSVDVITGTIKANFPTRISFQVTSKIDSRTILGEQGAEQLLGQGDMLHMAGGGRISRVHGAFVSDEEVETVVQFLKRQGVPEYLDAVTDDAGESEGSGDEFYGGSDAGGDSEANSLYDQAVAIVARDRKASTSYIQRRLSIGYNRAATIIEQMEDEGVVGPANHAGKREILVPEPSFEDG